MNPIVNIFRASLYVVGILIVITIFVVIYLSIAPTNFPSGKIFSITKNTTVSETALDLEEQGIIRSAFMFKVYSALFYNGKGVQTGDFLFDKPQSVLRIAYRTAYGIQGLEKIKILITEGMNSKDISKILGKNITGFDVKSFLELAKKEEGYLFPDTYYFNPNVKPAQVISEMKAVFDKRIATIQNEISASKKQLGDILKMASIVEKEATGVEDRKIVAGILWKRIDAGMLLQVDPPFFYFLNKTGDQLTYDDLAVKSPYNLYLNKGLPPTPINNPGLDAILATVQPTASDYWFYLSDSKGNMHYARTYEGHLANKEKYLQ